MPTAVAAAVACAEVLAGLADRRAALELEEAEALEVGDAHRARCAVVAAATLETAYAVEAGRLARLEARMVGATP